MYYIDNKVLEYIFTINILFNKGFNISVSYFNICMSIYIN